RGTARLTEHRGAPRPRTVCQTPSAPRASSLSASTQSATSTRRPPAPSTSTSKKTSSAGRASPRSTPAGFLPEPGSSISPGNTTSRCCICGSEAARAWTVAARTIRTSRGINFGILMLCLACFGSMSYSTTLKTLGEIETDALQGLVTRRIPSLIYLMLHKESEFRAHNQLVGRAGALFSHLLAREGDHLYSEGVNTIWRAAGIEFSLAGRDVRYYSSEDVRSRHNILPGDCRPTKARLAPFRALQEKFGRRDFCGLHTFIWWNLEAGGGCGLSTQYGTSGGGSQPGALFLEALALVDRPADRAPPLLGPRQ